MKITILVPKTEFTNEQQNRLAELGEVVYTDSRREYPIEELIKLADGSLKKRSEKLSPIKIYQNGRKNKSEF